MAQLEALEDRRAIRIRHERYNAALLAAILINSHRRENSDPLTAFDFLPGFEGDPEEREREKLHDSIKHGMRLTVARWAQSGMTPDQMREERDKMLAKMRENGVEDPEQLFREACPDL